MKKKFIKNITIYQAQNGSIEFRGDFDRETIWGTQKQIAKLFGVDLRTINEHLKNIYKTEELGESATIRKFRIVQQEGKRKVEREVNFYNLDSILSVGYRVNSKEATQFRIWATKTLKQHLIQGYTINKQRIGKNYEKFMRAVSDVKALLPAGNKVKTEDVLELIRAFAGTWFSLDAYDKDSFPQKGASKKQVAFTAEELADALKELKKDLIKKKETTELLDKNEVKIACVELWVLFFSLYLVKMRIRAWKKKRRIFCISWSKIIRLRTAIKEVEHLPLYGFYARPVFCVPALPLKL